MRHIYSFGLMLAFVFFSACGAGKTEPNEPIPVKTVRPQQVSDTMRWTTDFSAWLKSNQYGHIAANQGWGGKDGACILSPEKDPVIMLHGNSTNIEPSASFSAFRNYLLANGYQPCDLYAITWIETNSNGSTIHHKANYISLVRDFIQAVKAYSGKAKVDVIAWSMGVTIGRKAIKGGMVYNDILRSPANAIDLGSTMQNDIDTFIGVAGVNRGLNSCTGSTFNSCSENGFKIDSAFLADLNGGTGGIYSPQAIASKIYSVYLPDDEYICGDSPRGFAPISCDIYGTHTSRIPSDTAGISFNINNSLFSSGWGTNEFCRYDPAYPNNYQYKCDHILVFSDTFTDLTPATSGKGSLFVLLKALRDNDISFTSNP